VWWCIPVIPALRRVRQEDHKFKTSLSYIARHRYQPHTHTHTKTENGVCVCTERERHRDRERERKREDNKILFNHIKEIMHYAI
jgi:hypothetical protein